MCHRRCKTPLSAWGRIWHPSINKLKRYSHRPVISRVPVSTHIGSMVDSMQMSVSFSCFALVTSTPNEHWNIWNLRKMIFLFKVKVELEPMRCGHEWLFCSSMDLGLESGTMGNFCASQNQQTKLHTKYFVTSLFLETFPLLNLPRWPIDLNSFGAKRINWRRRWKSGAEISQNPQYLMFLKHIPVLVWDVDGNLGDVGGFCLFWRFYPSGSWLSWRLGFGKVSWIQSFRGKKKQLRFVTWFPMMSLFIFLFKVIHHNAVRVYVCLNIWFYCKNLSKSIWWYQAASNGRR